MTYDNIRVHGKMIASNPDKEEAYTRWYADDHSLHLFEEHSVEWESDFANGKWIHESFDNGRTWGEWKDVYAQSFERVGEVDEILKHSFEPNIYDKVSGNRVSCGMLRYFIGGHEEAYRKLWSIAGDDYRDHCYLMYRRPDGKLCQQLVAYEEGADYDPENPRNPDYLDRNLAYFGNVHFASNGDLLFPVGAGVKACCRILGLSLEEVFPSCPQIMAGMILVRGHWNDDTENYELSYSKPVVINDLLSSRGVCEPCVCELPNGRIVVVFRGSNYMNEGWHTRIEPHAPGFKWFVFSDDGGKTFTPPMPWYFDSREVVYSSATISDFFTSSKTGKTYWIGNITDPTQTYGNYPRYPLVICEVDEQYGILKKDTLTIIDTRRDGDSELMQLSNFTLFENRETKNLEVRLCKIGQHSEVGKGHDLYSETWVYEIELN